MKIKKYKGGKVPAAGREFTPLECCGTVKKEFFLNLFQAAEVHKVVRGHYIVTGSLIMIIHIVINKVL